MPLKINPMFVRVLTTKRERGKEGDEKKKKNGNERK